jgi:hypothetical protein
MQVAAVVSGFRFATEPVFDGATQLAATVRSNTGIVIAYDIKYALALIEKNPAGAKIVK